MKENRPSKIIKSITAIFLAAFVLLFAFVFLISEKQEFSEGENRYLEKFPEFTFSSSTLQLFHD